MFTRLILCFCLSFLGAINAMDGNGLINCGALASNDKIPKGLSVETQQMLAAIILSKTVKQADLELVNKYVSLHSNVLSKKYKSTINQEARALDRGMLSEGESLNKQLGMPLVNLASLIKMLRRDELTSSSSVEV